MTTRLPIIAPHNTDLDQAYLDVSRLGHELWEAKTTLRQIEHRVALEMAERQGFKIGDIIMGGEIVDFELILLRPFEIPVTVTNISLADNSIGILGLYAVVQVHKKDGTWKKASHGDPIQNRIVVWKWSIPE